MRILLVEDEPALKELLAAVLADEGHDVQTAADGDEAIALLNKGSTPHLVITDFAMPRKTGIEVLTAAGRIPEFL